MFLFGSREVGFALFVDIAGFTTGTFAGTLSAALELFSFLLFFFALSFIPVALTPLVATAFP